MKILTAMAQRETYPQKPPSKLEDIVSTNKISGVLLSHVEAHLKFAAIIIPKKPFDPTPRCSARAGLVKFI
ncbi:MAG: hypothetical protein K9N36_01505 [Candidatus Marinimicrobia bacterium]|nr:hypothetical protein [Candidatus Neomarinimicrobiota bacterium]